MTDGIHLFETTWGWMGLTASHHGIQNIVLPKASRQAVCRSVHFGKNSEATSNRIDEGMRCTLLKNAEIQLVEFLEHRRRLLDFSIDMSGGTSFQRQVWKAILRIPYGRVRSYRWVADRVGGPQFARAVGHALGANPLPIIVPCHRVVTSAGSLGGFTGGLPVKRRLLQLEGTLVQLRLRG